MQKQQLVAVDTNILLSIAEQDDLITDALELLTRRIRAIQLIASHTVLAELVFKSKFDANIEFRNLAAKALRESRAKFRISPEPLTETQRTITSAAAKNILRANLLPVGEQNDALVIAESAILNCILLVSNDSHLLEVDPRRLALMFREMDLPAPLIVSPRELIEKFYR